MEKKDIKKNCFVDNTSELADEQFNREAINALNNVLEGKNLSKEFNSVEELMNDLNGEDNEEELEDEYDLNAYNKAMEEYKKDPTTYALDEVERELGLSVDKNSEGGNCWYDWKTKV